MQAVPSRKVICVFTVLFVALAGWLWYLGRPETSAPISPTINAVGEPLNLPDEFVVNWPEREALIQETLAQKYAGDVKPKELKLDNNLIAHYSRKNLTITAKAGTSTIEAYGRALSATLAPYGESRENEVALVSKIYDTQNPKDLEKLAAVQAMHQKVLNDFLKMTTPENAAEIHLAITNDLYLLTKLAEGMQTIMTEPIFALQSARHYQIVLISFYARLSGLNDYFLSQGVNLPPDNKINIFINIQ